jgi:hypothetical protein
MGLSGLFKNEPHACEIIDGVQLKCTICGHDHFWKRNVQLNSLFAELINMAWTSDSADCYVCAKCDHIHWFAR